MDAPPAAAPAVPCPAAKEAGTGEDECCVICFEQRPFITLPCACKVNYCAACWDRALASSVSVRGVAQCPSCRSVFRVDFEPDLGGLVFSTDAAGAAQGDWRSRLYGKAKPVQIQLLRSFGSGFPEAAPRGDYAQVKLAEAVPLPAPTPEGQPLLPFCVCGAHLEHISGRARILRMLEDTDPGWRSRVSEAEGLVERLLGGALVTCDLCGDGVATQTGGVWTCKNGPHTVLHPAAYDVCEPCFARYAGPGAAASCGGCGGEGQEAGPCAHGGPGCCRSCLAAMRSVAPPWHWRRRPSLSEAASLPSRARRFVESTLEHLR